MWALKNSFLVSMYLNFDRRKTRFETVLHTLFICESQRSLLSMVIPKRQSVLCIWIVYSLCFVYMDCVQCIVCVVCVQCVCVVYNGLCTVCCMCGLCSVCVLCVV